MIQNLQDKAVSMETISKINQVEGFHPEEFAVEFLDLTTGEIRKRLPVMIQIAWFRLKYPEGRISVQVAPGKDCFIATAKVYCSYQDPVDCFLAEATASRGPDPNKPSVSLREWAQTAAVGIALRNAGFGLQFAAAGDEFEKRTSETLPGTAMDPSDKLQTEETVSKPTAPPAAPPAPENYETVLVEPTEEEKLQKAMQVPCPIKKYAGKSLGEILTLDANALNWIATKYTGSAEVTAAAKLICEYAVQQATA